MHSIETPKKAYSRHRLYVVLPVFFAFAVGIGGHNRATLLPVDVLTESGSLTMVDGDRMMFDGGSITMSGETVQAEGVSLVASKGHIFLDAGAFQLEGWNGAFEISAFPSKLTVAALTTPVLISEHHASWLVPIGMQITIQQRTHTSPVEFVDWLKERIPIVLPAHYLREQLPKAEYLYSLTAIHVPIATRSFIPPLAGSALMLEQSREKAEKQDRAQRFEELWSILLRHDLTAFDEKMNAPDLRSILDTANQSSLFSLLSLALDAKRDAQILPSLLQDSHSAGLLRLHPFTRDRVWQPSNASYEDDILLLTQILQPLSDRRAEPSTAMSIQAWHDSWHVLADHHALTPDILHALLPLLIKDIAALDTEGYPARARGYAVALVTRIQPFADSSETIRRSIEELRSLYDIPLIVIEEPEDVVVMQPAVETIQPLATPITPATSLFPESTVRAMLSDAGFMITSQSAFHRRDDGIYEISQVVLGTPSGDRIIDFTLNPVARVVMDIEKNGQVLPYTLSFEKYVEWVRGQ